MGRAAIAGLALAGFAVSVLVYLPTLGFSWVGLDDGILVLDNAYLHQGLSPAGLHWAFTTGTRRTGSR